MMCGKCLVNAWHMIGVQQIIFLAFSFKDGNNFEPWDFFPLYFKETFEFAIHG